MEDSLQYTRDYLTYFGIKLIGAIIVLLIGLWAIRLFVLLIHRMLDKRKDDAKLNSFVCSITSIILKVLLIMSLMSMIGIDMTAFIVILAAVALALGLALSGALQNFAGGASIFAFKPFKVGDTVKFLDYFGVVKQIQIFNTIITTPDNKTIVIPNSKLYSELIENYSVETQHRVKFDFNIGYNNSFDSVKLIISNVLASNSLVLKNPEPIIIISEFLKDTVKVEVKFWVDSQNYSSVESQIKHEIFNLFSQKTIN